MGFRHQRLFEELNTRQSRDLRQLRLGVIAREEYFGTDMLGRGYMNKIPGSCG